MGYPVFCDFIIHYRYKKINNQRYEFFVASASGAGAERCRGGNGIATPVCQLVRNDRGRGKIGKRLFTFPMDCDKLYLVKIGIFFGFSCFPLWFLPADSRRLKIEGRI